MVESTDMKRDSQSSFKNPERDVENTEKYQAEKSPENTSYDSGPTLNEPRPRPRPGMPEHPIALDCGGMATAPSPLSGLPLYKCHKIVGALKIRCIIEDELPGVAITPEEGYPEFHVSDHYLSKHNPQVGGYFVVYEDGYQSYSPAKAFEDGYTRI